MNVYLPPLYEDDLEETPGATGFSVQGETIDDTLVVPCYTQGAMIGNTDLAAYFLDSSGRPIEPYSLTYAIYYVSSGLPEELILQGLLTRRPLGLRTGIYRPNFQIGDKWYTGNYKIIWTYQVTKESAVETKENLFSVASEGLYDNHPITQGYLDIPASVVIV